MQSIRQPVMTNFCQGTCHDIFNRVSPLNHIFLSIRLESNVLFERFELSFTQTNFNKINDIRDGGKGGKQ